MNRLRDRRGDVALAPAEQVELVVALEQVPWSSSRDGTASAITCTILRANSRSTTVSTAWPATNVTISAGFSPPKSSRVVGQQPARAASRIRTVLSPSNVVKMSVSAFSAANRLTAM